MQGRRIFITGGTGFFGCWLVESFCHMNRLLGLGAEAVVLSRDPGAFARKCPHLASDPAVTLLAGDVRNFVFPEGEFGFAIHAATEASAKQAAEEPMEMLSTIIAGTERTLQFAAARAARSFCLPAPAPSTANSLLNSRMFRRATGALPILLMRTVSMAKASGFPNFSAVSLRRGRPWNARLPAAGPSVGRTCHSTSILPSGTSSETF